MKFSGILPEIDLEIISRNANAVNTSNRTKRDLEGVISNVFYLCHKYIGRLSLKSKTDAVSVTMLAFNTLLDREINPLAAEYTRKALECFNNCIFDEEMYSTWDELHGCDIFERMEVLGGEGNVEVPETKV